MHGYRHWMGADAVSNRRVAGMGIVWGGAAALSYASFLVCSFTGGRSSALPIVLAMFFVVVATCGSFALLVFVSGGELGRIEVRGHELVVGPSGPRIDLRAPVVCEALVSRVVLRSARAQNWGPAVELYGTERYVWLAYRVRQGAVDLTFRCESVPVAEPLGYGAKVLDRMPAGTEVVHTSLDALQAISRFARG